MAHEEAYLEVPMTALGGGSPDAVAIFDTMYGRELRRVMVRGIIAAMISGHYAGALLFGPDGSILQDAWPAPPGWAVYPAGAPS